MQITSPTLAATAPDRAVAVQNLERAFLEEMLKHAGPAPMEGPFSGGAGEDHFASFLTREHAAVLADRLDLGFDGIVGGGA
ncbi:flagellar protein FlgJ [Paracoccus zeaxanthinifaciens]|uniref:flagellar protein FlgJ n=1 Tax=Paracoccus zeaxanthinifaciens TaxID=187400 RepID=UPI0003B324DC|nr:flagellar protein FlgJ [Paracoccus zeaxanthinifaciens]